MRNQNIILIAYLAVFTSMMVIMAFVPNFGFIPVGPFSLTLLQIPVVIGAIYFGKKFGLITGFIFGATSLIIAYIRPTQIFDYFFQNPLVSILPRILFGYLTAVVFISLKKIIKNNVITIAISSVIGSMLNSIFVLGIALLIYLNDFGGFLAGIKVILGVLFTASLIEAGICGVISTAIVKALYSMNNKENVINIIND